MTPTASTPKSSPPANTPRSATFHSTPPSSEINSSPSSQNNSQHPQCTFSHSSRPGWKTDGGNWNCPSQEGSISYSTCSLVWWTRTSQTFRKKYWESGRRTPCCRGSNCWPIILFLNSHFLMGINFKCFTTKYAPSSHKLPTYSSNPASNTSFRTSSPFRRNCTTKLLSPSSPPPKNGTTSLKMLSNLSFADSAPHSHKISISWNSTFALRSSTLINKSSCSLKQSNLFRNFRTAFLQLPSWRPSKNTEQTCWNKSRATSSVGAKLPLPRKKLLSRNKTF